MKSVAPAPTNELLESFGAAYPLEDPVIERVPGVETALVVTAEVGDIEAEPLPALNGVSIELVGILFRRLSFLIEREEKLDEAPQPANERTAFKRPVPRLHELAVKIGAPVPRAPEKVEDERPARRPAARSEKRRGLEKELQGRLPAFASRAPAPKNGPAELGIFASQVKPPLGTVKEHEGESLVRVNIFEIAPRAACGLRPALTAYKRQKKRGFGTCELPEIGEDRELNSLYDDGASYLLDLVRELESAVRSGLVFEKKAKGKFIGPGTRPIVENMYFAGGNDGDRTRSHSPPVEIKAARLVSAKGDARAAGGEKILSQGAQPACKSRLPVESQLERTRSDLDPFSRTRKGRSIRRVRYLPPRHRHSSQRGLSLPRQPPLIGVPERSNAESPTHPFGIRLALGNEKNPLLLPFLQVKKVVSEKTGRTGDLEIHKKSEIGSLDRNRHGLENSKSRNLSLYGLPSHLDGNARLGKIESLEGDEEMKTLGLESAGAGREFYVNRLGIRAWCEA